ncbi:MAG TPA: arginine repressor [Actinomycetota bacterium]|nr:arginine repressor [Actinomycetota bacterium]
MKRQRQQALLELVRKEPLSTQEEIRAQLESIGHPATQSTISRDLEELGLVRVRDPDGHFRYALPTEASAAGARARLRALFAEFVSRVDSSGNIVVVTTPAGAANAVAEALDRAGVEGILGTIAGDDTIMIVAKEGVRGKALAKQLREVGGLS